MVSRS
jgi:hypothetical protein